ILRNLQFTFLSMPFKNALTGKELFAKSAQAVIISNSIKIGLIFCLYLTHAVTLFNVSVTLAISNFIELLVYIINSYKVFNKSFFSKSIDLKFYKQLLRESLPQLGVIIFDSAFARIDWILLGLLSTTNAAVNTAEYSFAYKIFELSRLPLLILAPILFTRFSKLFFNPANITNEVSSGIYSFFKIELIIGMIIPLLLNISWTPLMQFFTSGKYGPENEHIYFILSLTVPIMYMINFLWTIAFAQGQLKLTMSLSIINSVLNVIMNIILIPLYGQTGAALSFLICNVIMFPIYLYFVNQKHIKFPVKESVIVVLIATVTGVGCYFIPIFFIYKCCICVLLYILIIYGLKILTFAEIKTLKHFINKN
ncbi:MAG: polysaccharide biosynthesis C-terminal domain-containing protein, partial [Bacteroidota bacterium]